MSDDTEKRPRGRPEKGNVRLNAYIKSDTSDRIAELQKEWDCKTIGEVIDKMAAGTVDP